MREALSVIIREMLNVIRSGCEGSVPVVRKTGKASFRAPAKNLSPWWGDGKKIKAISCELSAAS